MTNAPSTSSGLRTSDRGADSDPGRRSAPRVAGAELIRLRLRRHVGQQGSGPDSGGCRCLVRRDFTRVQQPDGPGRGARPRDRGAAEKLGLGSGAGHRAGRCDLSPLPARRAGSTRHLRKVNVFRNQRAPQPAANVYGSHWPESTNQGVRATATAQIVTGDTTDCLKPWAVVDRWVEFAERANPIMDPTPTLPTSTFDRYSDGRGNSPPQENDVYRARPPPIPAPVTSCPQTRAASSPSRRAAVRTALSSGWFMEFACRGSMGTTAATFTERTSQLWRAPLGLCGPGNVCPARHQ